MVYSKNVPLEFQEPLKNIFMFLHCNCSISLFSALLLYTPVFPEKDFEPTFLISKIFLLPFHLPTLYFIPASLFNPPSYRRSGTTLLGAVEMLKPSHWQVNTLVTAVCGECSFLSENTPIPQWVGTLIISAHCPHASPAEMYAIDQRQRAVTSFQQLTTVIISFLSLTPFL